MDLGIKGKYALVTGGSHGIGRAIALALADEGCNVAICARDEVRVERVVEEIESRKVSAIGIRTDVLVREDIERSVQTVIKSWQTLHILVNNVGGGGRWGQAVFEETDEQVWLDVYNKNALAAIRFTMMLIPFFRRQRWGRVVTIGSIYGREGGGRPWFNMAKSAEMSLMKTLAMTPYLVRDGITFNYVAPGGVMIPDTGWEKEMQDHPDEFKRMVDAQFPLGRMGMPEEIGHVVAFICSEKASLLNGAIIAVDGGESKSF
ncbi:MAG: SDR family oxidoreductase [Thermodesulfobacteriota bacterium]